MLDSRNTFSRKHGGTLMKTRILLALLLSCLLALGLIVAGCGGGDDDSPTTPTTPFNVTGRWEIARTSGWAYLVLHLTQTGETITGTADRAALNGAGNDNGVITGTNVNNAITLTIQYDDTQINLLTGTITSATAMGGTFTTYYPGNTPSAPEAWGAGLNNNP
jgi:hypothetical protein